MAFETQNRPETRNTQGMLPPEQPDRTHVALDNDHLVAEVARQIHVVLDCFNLGSGPRSSHCRVRAAGCVLSWATRENDGIVSEQI